MNKFPKPKISMTGLVVFIILLVVAGIAAMIGMNVVDNVQDSIGYPCNNDSAPGISFNETSERCEDAHGNFSTFNRTSEFNSSVNVLDGIGNLTGQFPNIGLVVAAVVIIGLLIAGFAFAFKGGGGVSAI